MLNSQDIIQQSDLRENLASHLSRVTAHNPIYISSRGLVKYKVSLAYMSNPRKIKALLKQIKKVQNDISRSKLGSLNTTELIRNQRIKRTTYLATRDGQNI